MSRGVVSDDAGMEMTEKLYQLAALLAVLRIEQCVAGPSPYQADECHQRRK